MAWIGLGAMGLGMATVSILVEAMADNLALGISRSPSTSIRRLSSLIGQGYRLYTLQDPLRDGSECLGALSHGRQYRPGRGSAVWDSQSCQGYVDTRL